MADVQSQIRAQQQKEGVSGHKKGSINQPSDIYALILPVRGGFGIHWIEEITACKKDPSETIIISVIANLKKIGNQSKIIFSCL